MELRTYLGAAPGDLSFPSAGSRIGGLAKESGQQIQNRRCTCSLGLQPCCWWRCGGCGRRRCLAEHSRCGAARCSAGARTRGEAESHTDCSVHYCTDCSVFSLRPLRAFRVRFLEVRCGVAQRKKPRHECYCARRRMNGSQSLCRSTVLVLAGQDVFGCARGRRAQVVILARDARARHAARAVITHDARTRTRARTQGT